MVAFLLLGLASATLSVRRRSTGHPSARHGVNCQDGVIEYHPHCLPHTSTGQAPQISEGTST
jgi:hypothetical protein